MFADFIGLLGPFDSVLQEIRSLLLSRTALLPQHIRTAAQLPYGNPLRILIAEACVKPYAWSLQLGGRNGSSKRRFRFQKEMDTIDGFASNVVRAFTNSIRGNKTFIDPFTKELLDPHKSGYHSYYDRGTRISQAQLALKKSSEKKRTPKHTSRIEYSGDEDYDA